MALLINTEADLKNQITVSATFDFKKVLPYVKRADRKYIIKSIGLDQYNEIIIHTLDPDSDNPIDQIKMLLQEASAHFAMALALPVINIQITNSGVRTTENEKSSPADWKDLRDLKRSVLETANEAMDQAFEIMEANESSFPDWVNSNQYTVFKSGIVRHTSTFQNWFDIQNSRKTFMALKPYMSEVEEQYLMSFFGQCTLDFIKANSSDPIVQRVQELTQKAVVAFTISKAAVAGTFSVTQSSLVLQAEELPWERTKMELDEDKLERLRRDRETSGLEYLKKIKKILLENPTIFNCYEDKKEKGLSDKIKKLKSGLSI